MAIRYKALTELYQETQRKVTAPAEWQQFLTSACRNYRLSFDEQLLVYAQRPDATAVLEIERWNKRFGRWVNRGANGIAVFDGEHSGKQRLKYYFDVSDTHEGRFSRPVPLWTVRSEYAPDIIEALENSFGELEQKDNLGAALLSAAKNAVEDNIHDYLSELSHLTEVPRPQPARQRLSHAGRRRYHHLCKGDFDPDYRLIQNGSLGAGRLRPAPDFAGKEVIRCPRTG